MDDRKYRYHQLQNGLRTVLVSDPTAQKCSASLILPVGSLNEPIDGLSHFCEHMLFLGTKKYPKENYYSEFISQGGGGQNAATSDDWVMYYFNINSDQFEKALDIFSEFFKDPLFSADAVQREISAVDNEF